MMVWLSAWRRALLFVLVMVSGVLLCGCETVDRLNPLDSCSSKPNGAPCDDGTACTQGDVCQGGLCMPGAAVACAPSVCNEVSCDPKTGACVKTPVTNGSACSDGNACTLNESCQSGYCVPESTTTCTASDACHEAGACDPATGTCSNPPIADGADCDDGKTTTARDVCIAGKCTGYSAIDVVITTPANNTITKNNTIQVTGTVSEPATVTIGTMPVGLAGLSFSAVVPLEEGSNVLAVQAKGAGGNIGGASTVVLRDTTSPRLTILSPSNNALLVPGTTTVTGIVQDLVLGTVNAGDCTVVVNGVQAVVENRAFRATGVPVSDGDNTVTAIATDPAGNKAAAVLRVVGDGRPGARISVASGDTQSGIAGTTLAQPFTAVVKDNAGAPVPGVEVTFELTRGNGTLGGGARREKVMSDAAGMASVTLTLGSRAGIAQNQVSAKAAGFLGTALFSADGTVDPAAPRTLSATMGGIQRGLVSSLLPQPLVVVLADDKGNAVSNADVTFTVTGGGGLVNNQPSVTLKTDADGRAFVLHALGPGEGIGTQVVEVTSMGATTAAHFASSAYKSDPNGDTTLVGTVLSNQNHPIANVLLSIKDTNLTAVSDAEGHFEITGVPAGHIHLDVDGTTAGPYPPLRSLEMDTLPGIANEVDRPIYLPLVDTDGIAMANATSDVVIRRKDLPGFEMRVPAGSATFKNMSKTGLVQVIRVHRDKVPMLAPDGTLPTIAFAIMPADVHFDPPAAIRFPNVDGRPPGEIVTIYSFDHDLYEFVAIATATVSEDGQEVRSEAGQGIVKGGWHHAPPVAATAGTGKCVKPACTVDACPGSTADSCRQFKQVGDSSTLTRTEVGPSVVTAAPDGDCYNSPTISCLSHALCIPEPVADRSCIRGYSDGDPFVGQTGKCVLPTFDPQLDSKSRQLPVCCPDGHFCANTAGCPMYDGKSVCCEKPCDPSGCCIQ